MRQVASVTPWHRQFWPWFLIALPAASVLGSVAALVIAVRNADSVVQDDWYRRGLAIDQDRARARLAADLGIEATVSLDEAQREVRVAVVGMDGDRDGGLALALHHPTHATRDRTLQLTPDGGGRWRATVDADLRGRWHVTILPSTGPWTLAASVELSPGASVRLVPRS